MTRVDGKSYFVVRSSGIKFSIEEGSNKVTEHEQQKPGEHGFSVLYECEVPASMTVKEATRLYEAGVRAKIKPPEQKGKLVLAQVLEEKRKGRAEARGRKK